MVHIAFKTSLENIRKIREKEAKLTFLRLDNGTEYLTESMKEFIKKENITLQLVPTYLSYLNGTVERYNLELQQKIRCLL